MPNWEAEAFCFAATRSGAVLTPNFRSQISNFRFLLRPSALHWVSQRGPQRLLFTCGPDDPGLETKARGNDIHDNNHPRRSLLKLGAAGFAALALNGRLAKAA